MPKSGSTGPSYAGRVDVSSPDTLTPEWAELTVETNPPVAANEYEHPGAAGGDVSRETSPKSASARPAPKSRSRK